MKRKVLSIFMAVALCVQSYCIANAAEFIDDIEVEDEMTETCMEENEEKAIIQSEDSSFLTEDEEMRECEYETTTIPATCTEEGKFIKTCKIHGETITEIIPKKEHELGEWETVKEATVCEEGCKEQKCTVCGMVVNSQTIAKLLPTLTLNVDETVLMQARQRFTVMVTNLAKGDGVYSWTSSNRTIATVSQDGKITAKKAGLVTITVRLNSGYSKAFKVRVSSKTSITIADIKKEVDDISSEISSGMIT